MAAHFLPPKPTPDHEVNHKNGIKTDCAKANLEWITRAGNAQHAIETGLNPRRSGITTDIIRLIKADLAEAALRKPSLYGEVKKIAEKYGLSMPTISAVNTGKLGRHV